MLLNLPPALGEILTYLIPVLIAGLVTFMGKTVYDLGEAGAKSKFASYVAQVVTAANAPVLETLNGIRHSIDRLVSSDERTRRELEGIREDLRIHRTQEHE